MNAILYYAPTIFKQLGLTGLTTSLLATGVVGVVMFLATIPAVLWIVSLESLPSRGGGGLSSFPKRPCNTQLTQYNRTGSDGSQS
ncbi:MFS transporter [Candidatus Bathyarchaeota archaeon]|nr:MFS transporter [Candidatus Bathyarchaeota archaeon]